MSVLKHANVTDVEQLCTTCWLLCVVDERSEEHHLFITCDSRGNVIGINDVYTSLLFGWCEQQQINRWFKSLVNKGL